MRLALLLAAVEAAPCANDGSDASMNVVNEDSRRAMNFTNCPMYDWSTQSTPNSAEKEGAAVSVPLQVKLCNEPISIGLDTESPDMGEVGVTLEGVYMYTPVDAEYKSSDSYAIGRNAVKFEGTTVGTCGSHATPFGALHYHAHPGIDPNNNGGCKLKCDKSNSYKCNFNGNLCEEIIKKGEKPCFDFTRGTSAWFTKSKQGQSVFGKGFSKAKEHSLLLGFVKDGIPIYGFLNSDGEEPTDLDKCNGHTSDLGFYHYHATRTFPYLIGCYKGVPQQWGGRSGSGSGRKQDAGKDCESSKTEDYSSLLKKWTYGNEKAFEKTAASALPAARFVICLSFFLAMA